MAKILIVDDELTNREILKAFLDETQHHFLEASNGYDALDMARDHNPDLVLLDVMMPGIDGFEVVRRLRATMREYLPIVLITARTDRESRVEGLDVGADEFLSKPVDSRELLLRVSNLLRLKAREHELQQRNVEQMELHRFKDEMTSLIVHDLKNPVAAVIANLNFVKREPGLSETVTEALDDASLASQRMMRLIQNLYDVGRMESQRFQLVRVPASLLRLVEGVLQEYSVIARTKSIEVRCQIDPELRLPVDVDLVTRMVASLLDSSLRHAPARGRVDITAILDGGVARLTVGHGGGPIPVEARPGLFEKYAQATSKAGRTSLGLGLYFCRLVAEAHGGRISVAQAPEHETEFCVELEAV